MSFLLWDTIRHELLQCGSLPQAAVLHELLQCGCFLWGSVLQEQTAPAWVTHGVTSPACKPARVWAPLSMGPQVLPGACSNMSSPGVMASFRAHPPALAWGPPSSAGGYLLHCGPQWAAGPQPTLPWSSPRAARESPLWHLEHLLPVLLQ